MNSVSDPRGGSFRPRSRNTDRRRWLIGVVVLVLVLVGAIVVVPPLTGAALRAAADANPDLMRLSFVADAVGEIMDGRPDRAAGTDPTPVDFVIDPGMSSSQIIDALVARDLVTDRLAFEYVLARDDGFDRLLAGTHVLNRTMSPRQVAAALEGPAQTSTSVTVALRVGLRIEQVVAYLETLDLPNFDAQQFYDLASNPPASVRAKFQWLSVVPQGKSLEGFLGSGIFDVDPKINAEQMLDTLLQRWQDSPAYGLIAQAQQQGKDFYDIVNLASIVEREAAVDSERPLIAGVFQNRLDGLGGPPLLDSDPVIIYVKDLLQLRNLPIAEWPTYAFWTLNDMGSPTRFQVPDDLFGYQVYHSRGLPPTPICTPGLASLEAALNPDTATGYLYFVAKNDGSGTHAFARTYAEHQANVRLYRNGGATPSPLSPSPSA
jgi:UPF0755 protein